MKILTKEGLAVIAFLSLSFLAFGAGMKHTEVPIRSYCYSLSGLFHHKSAAVLLITSNTRTVNARYTVKPAYNGTTRNRFPPPVTERLRFVREREVWIRGTVNVFR